MKFRIEIETGKDHEQNPRLHFSNITDAVYMITMLLKEGYSVRICGVIEDD